MGCNANCPVCDCNTPAAPAAEAPAQQADNAKSDDAKKNDQAAAVAKTAIPFGEAEIALPKPAAATASLTDSLQKRRSIRAYTQDVISLEQLSALLWAANGINREDGKRTAPSAMNKQSVSIFVASEKGAYKYDHVNHKLARVSEDDLRPVKLAPVELIMTSNHENELIRGIDSGTVSQNVALYCAAEELATVIRMMRGDQSELQKALQIEANDLPLFNMAIGFEKK